MKKLTELLKVVRRWLLQESVWTQSGQSSTCQASHLSALKYLEQEKWNVLWTLPFLSNDLICPVCPLFLELQSSIMFPQSVPSIEIDFSSHLAVLENCYQLPNIGNPFD